MALWGRVRLIGLAQLENLMLYYYALLASHVTRFVTCAQVKTAITKGEFVASLNEDFGIAELDDMFEVQAETAPSPLEGAL